MYALRLRSSLHSKFPVARIFPATRRAPATPHVPATSPYAACTDLRGCRDRGLRSRFLFAGEYPPAGCIGGLRLRGGSRVTWTICVAGEEEYSGDSESESEREEEYSGDSESESEPSGDSESESEADSESESIEACQVVDDVPPDHICPACLRDHESPRCPVCNIPFLSNKLMHRHFQEKHNNAEWIAHLVSKASDLLSQQPPEALESLSELISKIFFGGN